MPDHRDLVMAPFTPFVTERVWQDLVVGTVDGAPDSVHLARWPQCDTAVVDDELAEQMVLVRRLVELGRGARAEGKVRTRQPLSRALVSAAGWERVPDELRAQVAEELNVQRLDSLSGASADELVDVHVKANFRSLGKRYGKATPVVASAVAEADPAALAGALRETGRAVLTVEGVGEVELGPDDIVVTETPREGWAVASDAGASVALDLALDDALRRLGAAREVVRLLQEARKDAGLEVVDRITVWWESSNEHVVAALLEHGDLVAAEVLATSIQRGPAPADAAPGAANDLPVELAVRRA
jgi:isoleucyl-tRNA synthetase